MDDDIKGMRRGKPQQQFYRPGCGLLKKGQEEVEQAKTEFQKSNGPKRGHGRNHGRGNYNNKEINRLEEPSLDYISNDDDSKKSYKSRKPEQPIYVPKRCITDKDENSSSSLSDIHLSDHVHLDLHNNHESRTRHYSGHRKNAHDTNNDSRQCSEPRNMSPAKKGMDHNSVPRNRDTRSMESSGPRHSHHSNVGKPPSGRRNSTTNSANENKGYWHSIPNNLPPRLKKKYLEENASLQKAWDGNSVVFQGHTNHHHNSHPPQHWSQTLPARGRGRLIDDEFDREKLKQTINPLMHNFESGSDSRSSTPHNNSHVPQQSSKSSNITTENVENILLEKLTEHTITKNHKDDTNAKPNQNVTSNHDAIKFDKNEAVQIKKGSNDTNLIANHKDGVFSSPIVQAPIKNTTDMIENNKEVTIPDQLLNCKINLMKEDWTLEDDKPFMENVQNDSNKRVSQNNSASSGKPKQEKSGERRGRGGRQGGGGGGGNGGGGGTAAANTGSEPKTREGRLKSGKKKRSSSRSSQKRERSIDTNRPRTEKSPHNHGQNKDSKDHCRDNKENVRDHRDNREHKDHRNSKEHDNRGYQRAEPIDKRQKNVFSRENSHDRRCFSRNNSKDRDGSRNNSRDRIHHNPMGHRNDPPPPPRVQLDPEKIKLPPPPPPNLRTSRNQSRRDSWSARGSRHASIESGVDLAYSPPRGGGRRRRRDSDQRHSTSSNSNNWREEMPVASNRRNTKSESVGNPVPERRTDNIGRNAPGILVLPQENNDKSRSKNLSISSSQNRGSSNNVSGTSPQGSTVNRTLYDWRNPNKPIVVTQTALSFNRLHESAPAQSESNGRPSYYNPESNVYISSHNKDLLKEIERADAQLQDIFRSCMIMENWDKIQLIRPFLQRSLQILLTTDIEICEDGNIEHHFWKMLYYNIIENLRKTMLHDETFKAKYVEIINNIIKDGNVYFENLLYILETTYKFKLDDYINAYYVSPPKGLGFISLALKSAQKIFIFLGDLARYKELVNDSTNYAKSKNWYTKANQINPKNGRPYNQLAILAMYGKRKLDAVYFYMRSLMSSNAFPSAKESLNLFFDENRKKYEASERKRLAERQKAVEVIGGTRGLRKEVWVRASGRRTTTVLQADKLAARAALSDDEELTNMCSIELNKRFIMSYLHVHGKLITKIGMETLSEGASMMLRQFRALLRHSPLPITSNRLLQLTALNMFAIESAQLKEESDSATLRCGYRSEVQERALAVSLRMFGALLERCCILLSTTTEEKLKSGLPVHDDVIVILPAIKVWCEWMLCHSGIWNPPPSDDFDVATETDPWPKLARLMNLLEPLGLQRDLLKSEPTEDDDVVRLPEESQFAGFTPLMLCAPETVYAPRTMDPDSAKLAVRTRRLLFFGTEYLCGLDPPALERRLAAPDVAEYVSVVGRRQPDYERGICRDRNDSSDSDIMEASMSEDEDSAPKAQDTKVNWASEDSGDEATKKLLRRRDQLEHRRRDLEKCRLRMQTLLRQGQVCVELEVRPRYLVPDTNCFIDHLPRLQRILAPESNTPYTLVVPLVVVSELEGLTRAARVGEAAQKALDVLHVRRPTLKFATTRGNLLGVATFTAEQDNDATLTNDDRILAASLSLCKTAGQQQDAIDGSTGNDQVEVGSDGVKRLVREVVLLTDDRNLRVKALARDLPVRDLLAFMHWAAIE